MFSAYDLAALIAVADAGSIHRAATVLGRTQPAVTQAIQRLEEAVGFPLLDRSGYRVTLTERGAIFAKRARVTVKQARDLRTFATVLERGVEACLRISIHGAISTVAWMHLFADIAERFPDTVLEIQTGEGDAPIRKLQSDESDFAIVLTATADQVIEGVERSFLAEMEFVNVVDAGRLTTNDEENLAALPQILVADFDDPTTGYGVVEGHRYWRVSDHRIKTAAIIAGAGWGSVPAHLVKAELQAGTLRAIAYRGIGPRSRRPIYLYQKRETTKGPVAAHIWAMCERLAQTNIPSAEK